MYLNPIWMVKRALGGVQDKPDRSLGQTGCVPTRNWHRPRDKMEVLCFISQESAQFVPFVPGGPVGFVPRTNVHAGRWKSAYVFCVYRCFVALLHINEVHCVVPSQLQRWGRKPKMAPLHFQPFLKGKGEGVCCPNLKARKTNPNPNFWVRIFSGRVGVFHVNGWGPKSSIRPSKPGKSNFLGGISRDFAGISRGRPKSLRKKSLCSISVP